MKHSAHFRVFVDTLIQVEQLEEYARAHHRTAPWSVFIKVDGGYRYVDQLNRSPIALLSSEDYRPYSRAGLAAGSRAMTDLITAVINAKHVRIFGFYSHFGRESPEMETS